MKYSLRRINDYFCALAGYQVRLLDASRERVDEALKILDKNLSRQATKGRITEEAKVEALKRIVGATGYDDLADCDLLRVSTNWIVAAFSDFLRDSISSSRSA